MKINEDEWLNTEAQPDEGFQLKHRIASISTLGHIIWLKKWFIIGVWLMLALPAGIILSFIDLPKSYTTATVMRFPNVVGAQTNMMRDIAITQSESIMSIFRSYQVLAATISRLQLRFRIQTTYKFRKNIFEKVEYSEDLAEGTYFIQIFDGKGAVLDFQPAGGRARFNLFEGGLAGGKQLKISGLELVFKPEFLKTNKNDKLECSFVSNTSVIESLAKRLKIKPLGSVNFEISMKDQDPFLVADIINTLRDEFLHVYYGTTEVQDVNVLVQLEKNLELAKERLEKSQNELSDFYKQNPSLLGSEQRSTGNPLLYMEYKSELTLSESRLNKLKSISGARPQSQEADEESFWANEVLTALSEAGEPRSGILKSKLYKINREYIEAQAKLSAGHPKLEELRTQIEEVVSETQSVARSFIGDYSSKVENLRQKAAQAMPGEAARPSVKVGLELERLTTANQNNENIYNNLLQSYNRAKLVTGSEFFKVTVVDAARPAIYLPPSLKSRLLVAVAFIGFLLLIIPFFFLAWHIVFLKFWTKTDVVKLMGLKALGEISFRPKITEPSLKQQIEKPKNKMGMIKQFGRSQAEKNPSSDKEQDSGTETVTLAKDSNKNLPDSQLLYFGSAYTLEDVESYRLLREECLNYFVGRSSHRICLLVTSTHPGEGKSTCASNLAISFARTGKKVLLVDADFRLGRIDTMFGYSSQYGLLDLLKSDTSTDSELMEQASEAILPTAQSNLFLAPKGSQDASAGELIGSDRLLTFLRLARIDFEVVIIDTPPVAITADPLSLLDCVDGVVYVCRSGMTAVSDARDALQLVMDRKVKIGMIVNAVTRSPFQGNRYSKYGYYYHAAAKEAPKP